MEKKLTFQFPKTQFKNLDEENWDMIQGQIFGQPEIKPNFYKFFMLVGKEWVTSKHICLYEGISGYLKLNNHVIIGQVTVLEQTLPLVERTPIVNMTSPFKRKQIPLSKKLWRFTNFEKFEDLISSKQLYYSRLDKFSDNLEGVSSYTSIKNILEDPNIREEDKHGAIELYMKRMTSNKVNSFVSCWHINDQINHDMWNAYGNGPNDSIAICTTKKIFDNQVKKATLPILNEPVQYFEEPYFNQYAFWFPTFFKRKSFESENELRSIIFMYDMGLDYFRMKVDLEKFITKIYVHPEASKEFFQKVKLLLKEHNCRISVVKLKKALI